MSDDNLFSLHVPIDLTKEQTSTYAEHWINTFFFSRTSFIHPKQNLFDTFLEWTDCHFEPAKNIIKTIMLSLEGRLS